MRVVIIEDEALAAERLADILHEVDGAIHIAAVIPSVEEAVRWLACNKVDVLFLDIQLRDGHSFDIFRRMSMNSPVIFTTAYDEWAIEAFRHNSIAYLLKPIQTEDVRQALHKLEVLRETLLPDVGALLSLMNSPRKEYKQRFLVQIHQSIAHIQSEDIAYFHAMDKCVFLTTIARAMYPVDYTLDTLQDMLDPAQFFRINRKLLIAYRSIAAMHAFSRSRIKIDLTPPPPRGIEALVSSERVAEFRKWIDT